MSGRGIIARDTRIDWQDLIRLKRTFTDPVPKSREESFAKAGIDTFHGEAHFIGTQKIQAGDEQLEAKHMVIATGADLPR